MNLVLKLCIKKTNAHFYADRSIIFSTNAIFQLFKWILFNFETNCLPMVKCIKWMLILFFTAFLFFVIYLESGGNFILNHSDKQLITYEMRSCKKLPENFTSFYNTVYPNSLFSDSWSYVIDDLLKPQSSRKECPCSQTAYRLFPLLEIHNKKGIDQFLTARYIEHHFTQQECLSFNFNKFDFLEKKKAYHKFHNLYSIKKSRIFSR